MDKALVLWMMYHYICHKYWIILFNHTWSNCLLVFIGKVLENFAQQAGIWKYCMHFIEKTNNEYVIMYCLNVLEVSTVLLNSST